MTVIQPRRIAVALLVTMCIIQSKSRPEEDFLLYAALLITELQIIWHFLNMPLDASRRTAPEIEEMQRIVFNACVRLTQALALSVNTGIHRLVHHLGEQLKSVECSCRGDTDDNETFI